MKYLTSIKPNFFSKINQDKLKNLTKNLTSKNIHNISKKSKISFQSQLSNYKNISSKKQSENLNDYTNRLINANNLIPKSKTQLYLLYEDIKKAKKSKESNDEDIKKYFTKRGRLDDSIDSLKKIYTMDIINKAKFITDKIQLERRGYCVIDSMAEGDKLIQLNFIPDGKTKAQSIITGKVDAKALAKGDKDDTEEKKEKKKKEREAKKAKKEEKKKKKEEKKEKKKDKDEKKEEPKEDKKEEKNEEKKE